MVYVTEYTGTSYKWTRYATTVYGYDLQGNLVRVMDELDNLTEMSYDAFGRKTSMTDPDMGTWNYTYDAAGNLVTQVDAKSQRLCFAYDALNRLQYKRHDSNGNGCETGDTQLAYYGYYDNGAGAGKVGQLAEIRWSSSATNDRETFDYDTLGRLISHTRIVTNRSYTMSYSNFDAFHRPTTITYPNGQTATIGYDREGENSLANSGVSLISDVRYNGRGQMTFLGRATGGIDTTYLYHPQTDAAGGGTGDSVFRLKTIQHGTAGTGNPWPDFTYEYDRVGNITKLTTLSTAGTDVQTFGYDHLNRLVSASASGVAPTYSDTYAYNAMGVFHLLKTVSFGIV
jgi:YD repeat-containing protein